MSRGGALFDIDGTLVDSNYLHVDAWKRVFHRVGQPVDAWRCSATPWTSWATRSRSSTASSTGTLDVFVGDAVYDDAAALLHELDDSPLASLWRPEAAR